MGNLQSSPSSSTTTLQEKYDVFLSFRGEDTRDGFTNNLYEALSGKKIKTFMDDQLTRGDIISQALTEAIEESKISVIIFSKDYASSKWCLRELIDIMELRKMNKQTVIPVFYGVEPSDVRNQTGSFKDSFVKHEIFFPDEVQKWREALKEASLLSGHNSSVTR
ncbi:hypothetical protein LWI29_017060 [Acer saccharum]|uniref:TIR domain-containing protein n=1 Tax=Acer saccharum TaxID=4024 RepID=A0AA39RDX6_ACESA|nr:hypothetical protein LWI29_017060 [Acer saccharum]